MGTFNYYNRDSKNTCIRDRESKNTRIRDRESNNTYIRDRESKNTCIRDRESKNTCIRDRDSKNTCIRDRELTTNHLKYSWTRTTFADNFALSFYDGIVVYNAQPILWLETWVTLPATSAVTTCFHLKMLAYYSPIMEFFKLGDFIVISCKY